MSEGETVEQKIKTEAETQVAESQFNTSEDPS